MINVKLLMNVGIPIQFIDVQCVPRSMEKRKRNQMSEDELSPCASCYTDCTKWPAWRYPCKRWVAWYERASKRLFHEKKKEAKPLKGETEK
jgi:hypothetical protein